MQNRSQAAGFSHDGRRMMTTDIVERTQDAVLSAHSDQWLTRDRGRHKLAGIGNLVDTAHHLPAPRKNRPSLQFRDARIHIPRRRNGRGLRQRSRLVIARNDVGKLCGRVRSGHPRCLLPLHIFRLHKISSSRRNLHVSKQRDVENPEFIELSLRTSHQTTYSRVAPIPTQ